MTPLRNSIWEAIPSLISSRTYIFFIKFKPNTITIVSGLFGLIGICLIFFNSFQHSILLGSILLFVFLILDYIDGDVARATDQKSKIGAWIDPFFDKLVEGFILLVAGYYALSASYSIEAYLVASLPIILFQLNQFLLIMDRLIHNQFISENKKTQNSLKTYSLLNLILKHGSLGHSALVLSFIFFINIGLIDHLSLIYLFWSFFTLLPTILAKLRGLLNEYQKG